MNYVALRSPGAELGRIAALSQRVRHQESPLERQARRIAWLIAVVAVGAGLVFLPLGLLAGLTFTEAAVVAVGLLVADGTRDRQDLRPAVAGLSALGDSLALGNPHHRAVAVDGFTWGHSAYRSGVGGDAR